MDQRSKNSRRWLPRYCRRERSIIKYNWKHVISIFDQICGWGRQNKTSENMFEGFVIIKRASLVILSIVKSKLLSHPKSPDQANSFII